MNLVAVKQDISALVGVTESHLTHHGECCDRAKIWLKSMARAYDFALTAPAARKMPVWLRYRYKWGPTQWPMAWCEAVREDAIDCGVFAAFVREILGAKGVEVFPAQIMLEQHSEFLAHWRRRWQTVQQKVDWIGEGAAYHEVCAVRLQGREVGIYDATDGLWFDPSVTAGFRGVKGVKVNAPQSLTWGEHVVGLNQWVML